jgi:hypothetical protein
VDFERFGQFGSDKAKNLSKNLREALCSFRWHTHHIADVTDLKFVCFTLFF